MRRYGRGVSPAIHRYGRGVSPASRFPICFIVLLIYSLCFYPFVVFCFFICCVAFPLGQNSRKNMNVPLVPLGGRGVFFFLHRACFRPHGPKQNKHNPLWTLTRISPAVSSRSSRYPDPHGITPAVSSISSTIIRSVGYSAIVAAPLGS